MIITEGAHSDLMTEKSAWWALVLKQLTVSLFAIFPG